MTALFKLPSRKIILFVLVVILSAIADTSLTYLHQPPGYWSGQSSALEGNILIKFLMDIHPSVIIAFDACYILLIALLLKTLTSYFRIAAGIAIFWAHAFGSTTRLLWDEFDTQFLISFFEKFEWVYDLIIYLPAFIVFVIVVWWIKKRGWRLVKET